MCAPNDPDRFTLNRRVHLPSADVVAVFALAELQGQRTLTAAEFDRYWCRVVGLDNPSDDS